MKKYLIGFTVLLTIGIFLFWKVETDFSKGLVHKPIEVKNIDIQKTDLPKVDKVDSSIIPSAKKTTSSPKLKTKINLIKGNLKIQNFINQYFSNLERIGPSKKNFLSQTLRAVAKKKFNPNMGKILEERAGFVIFLVSELSIKESYTIKPHSLPVVYDQHKNTLGIVTGNLTLEYSKIEDPKKLSRILGIDILKIQDGVIFGRTKSLESTEKMRKDPRVLSLEIEIIDSSFEPN